MTFMLSVFYALNYNSSFQFNLGYFFSEGKLFGFQTGNGENHEDAFYWYRKAAALNYPRAQYTLGIFYSHGWGVSKDEEQAVSWFFKAVENNYAESAFHLAWMYCKGEGGVSQNYAEAVRLFTQASSHCMSKAQRALGDMYELGEGVPHNKVVALKWYKVAEVCAVRFPDLFNNKFEQVKGSNSKAVLVQSMTPEEINQAEELAVTWFKSYKKI